MADAKKKLKIKTGVCSRLVKEVTSYKNDALKQQEKIAKMKAEGKDHYDIKKQEEVLAETQKMVPDAAKRLQTAFEDLSVALEAADDELKASAEYTDAVAASKSAAAFIASP